MYYNDIERVNGVVNWAAAQTDTDNDIYENGSDLGEIVDEAEQNNVKSLDDTSEPCLDNNSVEGMEFPKICVVLAGPFTSAQNALTYKNTKTHWQKI
jgi:hypothetical protein